MKQLEKYLNRISYLCILFFFISCSKNRVDIYKGDFIPPPNKFISKDLIVHKFEDSLWLKSNDHRYRILSNFKIDSSDYNQFLYENLTGNIDFFPNKVCSISVYPIDGDTLNGLLYYDKTISVRKLQRIKKKLVKRWGNMPDR